MNSMVYSEFLSIFLSSFKVTGKNDIQETHGTVSLLNVNDWHMALFTQMLLHDGLHAASYHGNIVIL